MFQFDISGAIGFLLSLLLCATFSITFLVSLIWFLLKAGFTGKSLFDQKICGYFISSLLNLVVNILILILVVMSSKHLAKNEQEKIDLAMLVWFPLNVIEYFIVGKLIQKRVLKEK